MPNRLSAFFSQWYKRGDKTAPKPINSPFSLGQAMLSELADCKRQLAELQKPREVVTHYEGDHETIENLKGQCELNRKASLEHKGKIHDLENVVDIQDDRLAHLQLKNIPEILDRFNRLENRIMSLERASHEPYDFTELVKRLEHLENNHIQALTRRISANWQRPRRKDGRWTKKKGGGHASV